MHGRADPQGEICHAFNVHDLISARHRLREIGRRADQVLAGMSREFNAACGRTGRPSIQPKRVIKAMLLMAPYRSRSERQFRYRGGSKLLRLAKLRPLAVPETG